MQYAATVSHEVYNNEHGIQIHFPLALFKKLKGSNKSIIVSLGNEGYQIHK